MHHDEIDNFEKILSLYPHMTAYPQNKIREIYAKRFSIPVIHNGRVWI